MATVAYREVRKLNCNDLPKSGMDIFSCGSTFLSTILLVSSFFNRQIGSGSCILTSPQTPPTSAVPAQSAAASSRRSDLVEELAHGGDALIRLFQLQEVRGVRQEVIADGEDIAEVEGWQV